MTEIETHLIDLSGGDLECVVGAWHLFLLEKKCDSCFVTSTPLWRKGRYDRHTHRHVKLCNACGLKYVKRQYCPYCINVYYAKDLGNDWITCSKCDTRTHVRCEKKYGNSDEGFSFHEYICLLCRDS